MDLIAVINADDLPALLREQPELASAHDEHGVSALLLAIYHRRPEARDALLAAGAPVGTLEAAALGDVERLEGADLSVRGGDGFTPLHLAAFFGGARAVGAILATGADPDADADNPFKRPPAALRRARPATASPPPRCSRPERTRTSPSRAATRRCTAPRTSTTPSSRRCCSSTARTRRADRGHRQDPVRHGRGGHAGAAQPVKLTLPLERARACARSMKSSRLIAARHRRATSFSRADSERRSSRPCLASSPNSTVAAIA